jgi:hypothetical protein
MLAEAKWKKVSWWRGVKGPLSARFAALRIRIADGPPQRILDKGQQHMPGEEAWLIGEWRSSGERKYYLSNLPANTNLKTLAAAIKARWVCEQAHQQMKEELGLDHFEGRSWQGLHRHALMTMIAYAFLQHQRLKQAKREKKNPLRAAATDLAGSPARRHQGVIAKANLRTMSPLPNARQDSMENSSAKVVRGARFSQIDGYRCLSLIRALAVVNCQPALAWLAFRSSSQAAISSMRVCLFGMRRSRHWDERTPSSDSAISSQLPCFGV